MNKNTFNLKVFPTKKFKTIVIRVVFKHPACKEDAIKYSFLFDMMCYTTKKFNNHRDFEKAREELYSVTISPYSNREGKIRTDSITLSVLDDKYTEKNNLEHAIKLLKEIIFNPDFTNKDSFDYLFNMYKRDLDNLKENKGLYSSYRATQELNCDDIFSLIGTKEELNSITPDVLEEIYKKVLEESQIDIYVVGNIKKSKISDILNKYLVFENNKYLNINPIVEYKNSDLKHKEIIDKDDSNQSTLVMIYKLDKLTKRERLYVSTLYSIILGYAGDSKLFKNIREKNSLCYYIYSNIYKFDDLMFIKCGINSKNYNKVIKLINDELKEMENGNFTNDELKSSKTILLNVLEEIKDNSDAIIDSKITSDMLGYGSDLKRKQGILKVTKKEIMDMSKKIHPVITYFLKGATNEED